VGILIALGYVGYDQLNTALQERQEWTGTIVRVYDYKPFLAGRKPSSGDRYWDIRTADGGTQSVRIRPRSLWSEARAGDWVVKRAGEANPHLVDRR
jgi:hypothetical protein